MLDLEKALEITTAAFPRGPEALAEKLGVSVERVPLSGCDGWCVMGDACIIVRVNSNTTPERQRFTLAHELAHIVTGTTPDVSPTQANGCVDRDEERIVDRIASQMLLPEEQIQNRIKVLPILPDVVRGIASDAGVSELVTVIRITALRGNIERNGLRLRNAFVADFNPLSDDLKWMIPDDPAVRRVAKLLLGGAEQAFPDAFVTTSAGVTGCSSVFSTEWSKTLFFHTAEKATIRKTVESGQQKNSQCA